MLRVSAVAVEGDRDQDLIGPDARHGSFVYRLRKHRRPVADGQGPQYRDRRAMGLSLSVVMSRLRRRTASQIWCPSDLHVTMAVLIPVALGSGRAL